MQERNWQNWDKGETAKAIDSYWINSGYEEDWRKRLVSDIKDEFGIRTSILEVGCGSGLIYEEMINHHVVTAKTYVGGDVSHKMLDIASSRYPKAKFIYLDIFKLPFQKKSQPNTICIHVLQHLPNYVQALKELIRITNGKLLISSWFTQESEDNIVFEDIPYGGPFYNNQYSLTKFLDFIHEQVDTKIEKINITKYREPTYSITVTFNQTKKSNGGSSY
jgi:ubiquinone/menaquinone biosynthesis C-methylase UbiE